MQKQTNTACKSINHTHNTLAVCLTTHRPHNHINHFCFSINSQSLLVLVVVVVGHCNKHRERVDCSLVSFPLLHGTFQTTCFKSHAILLFFFFFNALLFPSLHLSFFSLCPPPPPHIKQLVGPLVHHLCHKLFTLCSFITTQQHALLSVHCSLFIAASPSMSICVHPLLPFHSFFFFFFFFLFILLFVSQQHCCSCCCCFPNSCSTRSTSLFCAHAKHTHTNHPHAILSCLFLSCLVLCVCVLSKTCKAKQTHSHPSTTTTTTTTTLCVFCHICLCLCV